jgi:hypothetical protein
MCDDTRSFIMVIGRMIFLSRISFSEKGGEYFNNDRLVRRNFKTVEGPKMDAGLSFGVSSYESKPGNATVGRFADGPGAIQLENALCRSGPVFGQSEVGIMTCPFISTTERIYGLAV